MAFPRWAHLPGGTAGADHPPLAAAKALLPARFPGPPPADHPAILYGVALCDGGFYWEAHEVLEAAWLATALNSRDRSAIRAIIQLANAGLKLRMGRPRAAYRLLTETVHLLREAAGVGTGRGFAGAIRAEALAREIEALFTTLDGSTAPTLPAVAPFIGPMQENA